MSRIVKGAGPGGKILPKIVVILGPTASGKTELGIKLAQKFRGEIVSADSRQIYRSLNIATAKPVGAWQTFPEGSAYVVDGVRHHLVDWLDPGEPFSVAEYKALAVKRLSEIARRGHTPFLVGGTGLYIQAVVDNWRLPVSPPNPSLRQKLAKKSLAELTAELEALDKGAGQVVDLKNRRRVERAIEALLATGGAAAALMRSRGAPQFQPLIIGLNPPREELRRRIKERVERQFSSGLIDEVRGLIAKGLDLTNPGLSVIGYKEAVSYLKGEATELETKLRLAFADYHYARRQFTWFKRDQRVKWLWGEKNLIEEEAVRLAAEWLGRSARPAFKS